MKPRACAVIIRGKEILLMRDIKNGNEYYCFPGGSIEEGEAPSHAAVREMHEETGLAARVVEELFTIENQGRSEHYFLIIPSAGVPEIIGEEKGWMNETNQYHLEWHALDKSWALPNWYPVEAKEKLRAL